MEIPVSGALYASEKKKTAFLTFLKRGLTVRDACVLVGWDERFLTKHIEEGNPVTEGLEQEMEAAKLHLKQRSMTCIEKNLDNDNLEAAKWYLERKYPKEYGRKDKLDVEAKVDNQIIFEFVGVPSEKKSTEPEED
jgi:hypothetical protein